MLKLILLMDKILVLIIIICSFYIDDYMKLVQDLTSIIAINMCSILGAIEKKLMKTT
jgi:hypothetical protein